MMNDKTAKEIHISKETLVKRVLPAMIMLILVGLIAAFFAQKEALKGMGSDHFHSFYTTCLFVTVAVMALAYEMLFISKVRLEYVFLILTLSLGLIYNCMIPVYAVPDEDYHYMIPRSLASEWTGHGSESGIDNAFMAPDYETDPGFQARDLNREYMNKYLGWMQEERGTDGATWNEVLYTYRTEFYRIIYAPMALGIIIGRAIGLPYLMILLLGRAMSLFFYAACGFYAIRRSPIAKELILVLSLFPIFLQQISSFSSDGPINAMTIAVTGACMSLAWREKLDKFSYLDLGIALVFGIILGRCKYAACLPILLLIFLVLISRANIERRLKIAVWVIFAASIAFGTLPGLHTLLTQEKVLTPELGTVPYYTLGELLREPYRFFMILGNTFYLGMDDYWRSALGYSLGLYEMTIRLHQVVFFIPLVWMAAVCAGLRHKFSRREKTLFFIITFLGMGFAVGGMLIGWTPRTDMVISGIQGRYFLPFFIPMMFVLSPVSIRVKDVEMLGRKVVMAAALLEMTAIMTYLDVLGR